MKRENILLFGATGTIALGLVHADIARVIEELAHARREEAIAISILVTLPLLPFALAVTHICAGMRIHWLAASTLYPLIVLLGTLISLVNALVNSAVPSLSMWHGMALSFGLASSICLVSSAQSKDVRLYFGWVPMGLASLAGLWSLLTAGLVVLSSTATVGGQPFCIVREEQSGEVAGLADVRGFSLYATHTERGIIHDFHAVLVVEGREQDYNWSYTRLRFVETDHHTAAMKRCTPARTAFLERRGAVLEQSRKRIGGPCVRARSGGIAKGITFQSAEKDWKPRGVYPSSPKPLLRPCTRDTFPGRAHFDGKQC